MHILWINERASFTGGCERYIFDCVTLLQRRGVTSSLIYDVTDTTEPEFTQQFDKGAYPRVDLGRQIREIAPDLIYVHRLDDSDALQVIADSGVPSVRFFHDHKLFCPREHKYTVIGKETCTRTVGLNCYTCLGVINKVPKEQGFIRLTLPETLRREQRRNAATFTSLVVGSHYMADHIAAHGFDRTRIHVLPLFVAPPTEAFVQKPSPRQTDLLLFVGQLTTGKAVDILLNALAQTQSKPRLLIHGTGKFEAEYKALTQSLGLENRVVFGGKANTQMLAEAYQRATAVVFPSRTPETFGLVGPEAMSYGTPVIGTLVGGMTEWLEPEVTGLATPPNDIVALQKAIDRMITDTALQQRLGATGKERYLERFTPETHIVGLYSLFSELVGKSTRSSVRPLRERIAA